MNYTGLVIGVAVFVIIGLFHPIVIKAEYHLGKRCWWMFLLAGLIGIGLSLWEKDFVASTLYGVFAFCCLWSIGELFEQEKRVRRGWFPASPKKQKTTVHDDESRPDTHTEGQHITH